MGPAEMPWSMGTITQFPVFLSIILSILMLLPNIGFTPCYMLTRDILFQHVGGRLACARVYYNRAYARALFN